MALYIGIIIVICIIAILIRGYIQSRKVKGLRRVIYKGKELEVLGKCQMKDIYKDFFHRGIALRDVEDGTIVAVNEDTFLLETTEMYKKKK